MPREVIISAFGTIDRIYKKYGGWEGVMSASAKGEFAFGDYRELYGAYSIIGV